MGIIIIGLPGMVIGFGKIKMPNKDNIVIRILVILTIF